MLGGVAPIPADSGSASTPMRFRLNRYGDRQLNWALHTIMLSRLRWDPATQAYAQRRTTEGKTPREIKRCLIGGLSVPRSGQPGRGSPVAPGDGHVAVPL
jgi:hypothetical protein